MNTQSNADRNGNVRESSVAAPSVTAWRLFWIALVGSAVIQCVTLTISPPPWQDEVQIIDYGRTLMPGADCSYAASWGRAGRPVQLLTYVGCLIQELAYRLSGESMVGPRLSTLVGASFAAVCLHGWLRAIGVAAWIAAMTSCAFLWDPVFVQGYRGARVDCWCLGFMLAALCCLRRSERTRVPWPWLVGAGALIALSGLSWPSAVLLLPLLAHELLIKNPDLAGTGRHDRTVLAEGWLARAGIVGCTGGLCLIILLLPLWRELSGMVTDLSSEVNASSTFQWETMISRARSLPACFMRSPLLPIAALAGSVGLGPRSWLVAFVAAAAGVVLTGPYTHRAVYLLPYFALGFALVADRMWRRMAGRTIASFAMALAMSLPMVWSGAVSLGARTAVAVWEQQRRDPTLADRFVQKLTGGRRGRVLLGSWSLYYPFRSLGWRHWGPYDRRSPPAIIQALDYDLVVHDQRDGVHPLDDALLAKGYLKRVDAVDTEGIDADVVAKGTPGFGPYVIYTHPNWNRDAAHESQGERQP